MKRLDLYLQFERPLSADELAEYKARLRRRVRHEPLQYIEGKASFRELELKVDRRALIPRPETEALVGEILAMAAGRTGLEVLDIGTGSGAIALSLAGEGSFGRVVATDVSDDALALAAENAVQTGLRDRVELRTGALYAPVAGETFDLIVSNPPYVGTSERPGLAAEVVEWEPAEALFAGPDGLSVIAPLIAGAPAHLRPGGWLALEIGAGQGEAVAAIVRRTPGLTDVRIRPDFAGRDRIALATRDGARTVRQMEDPYEAAVEKR